MHFNFPVEIEPNTEAMGPTRVTCGVCRGRLLRTMIYFPWGCAGLVGVRIFHYEHQLYPTNPDEWITGNEILIVIDDDYQIDQGQNYFHVEAYNEDDFYSHISTVSFTVLTAGASMVTTPRVIGV